MCHCFITHNEGTHFLCFYCDKQEHHLKIYVEIQYKDTYFHAPLIVTSKTDVNKNSYKNIIIIIILIKSKCVRVYDHTWQIGQHSAGCPGYHLWHSRQQKRNNIFRLSTYLWNLYAVT